MIGRQMRRTIKRLTKHSITKGSLLCITQKLRSSVQTRQLNVSILVLIHDQVDHKRASSITNLESNEKNVALIQPIPRKVELIPSTLNHETP